MHCIGVKHIESHIDFTLIQRTYRQIRLFEKPLFKEQQLYTPFLYIHVITVGGLADWGARLNSTCLCLVSKPDISWRWRSFVFLFFNCNCGMHLLYVYRTRSCKPPPRVNHTPHITLIGHHLSKIKEYPVYRKATPFVLATPLHFCTLATPGGLQERVRYMYL